ncbi:MAG: tRNA (adenosine(37)-N6)-threonylcarbamoyltransferase complex dimerization subunit type 1 TsaB [Candidatus Coatesbacteria bacterium]|nr:tRNA (adenosine(37)-N6)-threonylcarbamoyltransferase complex dimerization subunit type 1 TsaB [Candidatus Coatesbacteria bacterium]
MEEVLLLAIDSATNCSGISLLENGNCIASLNYSIKKMKSENLVVYIKYLIDSLGYNITDINFLAVCKGPGTFTGIRIGMSISYALAKGLMIPLYAFNTLEVIVMNFLNLPLIKIPVINARKGQIYASVYDEKGEEILKPTVLNAEYLVRYIDKETLIIGNEIDYHYNIIKTNLKHCIYRMEVSNISCSLGKMAFREIKNNKKPSLVYPMYLRDADAVIPGNPKKV